MHHFIGCWASGFPLAAFTLLARVQRTLVTGVGIFPFSDISLSLSHFARPVFSSSSFKRECLITSSSHLRQVMQGFRGILLLFFLRDLKVTSTIHQSCSFLVTVRFFLSALLFSLNRLALAFMNCTVECRV